MSINLNQTFTGYFSSTPTNVAVPICNNILVSAFSDTDRTIAWQGSSAFVGSTDSTFNINNNVTVDTTVTLATQHIYLTGTSPAEGSTGVSQTVRVNICADEVVSLTGNGDAHNIVFQVGDSASVPDFNSLIQTFFQSSPTNEVNDECNN